MVDGRIRNVIWDMTMNVVMNGMMDGFFNVMMSEACLRGLVHHQLQLLLDDRRQCQTSLRHLKDQGWSGRCIVGGSDLL